MFSKCQRLFRSPSMPCSVIRPILKRIERPQDRDMPVQSKRRKSVTPLEEQQQPEEPVSSSLLGLGCHGSSGDVLGLKMVWGCSLGQVGSRGECTGSCLCGRGRGSQPNGFGGSLKPRPWPPSALPSRRPVSSAQSRCVTRLRVSWTVTTVG